MDRGLADARQFTIAVTAAVIDARRAAWKPRPVMEFGRQVKPPATAAFTREHVAALRTAGATKAQVLDYARHAGFNDLQVEAFESDLDSYGRWST